MAKISLFQIVNNCTIIESVIIQMDTFGSALPWCSLFGFLKSVLKVRSLSSPLLQNCLFAQSNKSTVGLFFVVVRCTFKVRKSHRTYLRFCIVHHAPSFELQISDFKDHLSSFSVRFLIPLDELLTK